VKRIFGAIVLIVIMCSFSFSQGKVRILSGILSNKKYVVGGENILTNKTVYDIVFFEEDEYKVITGTFQEGTLYTNNGGEIWHNVPGEISDLTVYSLCVNPINPDMIFAGTVNNGIYVSRDGGKKWEFSGLDGAQVWDIMAIVYYE